MSDYLHAALGRPLPYNKNQCQTGPLGLVFVFLPPLGPYVWQKRAKQSMTLVLLQKKPNWGTSLVRTKGATKVVPLPNRRFDTAKSTRLVENQTRTDGSF